MKPVCGPIEGAEKRARRDRRVDAASAFGRDQRANAALVAIALRDDSLAQRRGQRVHLEMGGRTVEAVNEAQDVRNGKVAEPRGERPAILGAGQPGGGERVEEAVQGSILAEEQ